MLPTLGNQRASFIVLTSPAPEGILLFQASPYEIKNGDASYQFTDPHPALPKKER